jgi:hypothetical protein
MGTCQSNNELSDIEMSDKEHSNHSIEYGHELDQNILNILDPTTAYCIESTINTDQLKKTRQLNVTARRKSSIVFKNSNGVHEIPFQKKHEIPFQKKISMDNYTKKFKKHRNLSSNPNIKIVAKKPMNNNISDTSEVHKINIPIKVKGKNRSTGSVSDSSYHNRFNSSSDIERVRKIMSVQKQFEILGYIPNEYNIEIHSLKK